MENRIYTKAQKEAAWKQKGLLKLPKSDRQGKLALAAKEFIEGLNCYGEVRRMLALGKRPRDVAILIQEQQKDPPFLTFNTLKKYAQAYRYFFISPLETLKANVDNRTEGVASIVDRKLNGLLGKVQEIELLEQKIKSQSDRIDRMIELEKTLNVPIAQVDRAMHEFNDMVNSQIDGKVRLGVYQSVPQKLELQGQILLSKINGLPLEDKETLKELGKTLYGIIDMARNQKG